MHSKKSILATCNKNFNIEAFGPIPGSLGAFITNSHSAVHVFNVSNDFFKSIPAPVLVVGHLNRSRICRRHS